MVIVPSKSLQTWEALQPPTSSMTARIPVRRSAHIMLLQQRSYRLFLPRNLVRSPTLEAAVWRGQRFRQRSTSLLATSALNLHASKPPFRHLAITIHSFQPRLSPRPLSNAQRIQLTFHPLFRHSPLPVSLSFRAASGSADDPFSRCLLLKTTTARHPTVNRSFQRQLMAHRLDRHRTALLVRILRLSPHPARSCQAHGRLARVCSLIQRTLGHSLPRTAHPALS